MISKTCSGCSRKIPMLQEKFKCWYNGCKKVFCKECAENKNGISMHELCKTLYCIEHISDHGCIDPKAFEDDKIKWVAKPIETKEIEEPKKPEEQDEEILQEIDESTVELNDETKELLEKRIKEAEKGNVMTSDKLREKLFGKKISDEWKVIPTKGLTIGFNNYDNISRALSFSIYSWVFDWYENKPINEEELNYVAGPSPFRFIDGQIIGNKDLRGYEFKAERLAKKYELTDRSDEVVAILGDLFIFMMRKRTIE